MRYLVTAAPGSIPTLKGQASVPHFGLLRPGAERGGVGSPQPAPRSLILQLKSHSNLLSQPCPRAYRQLPSAHWCVQGPDPARRSQGPPGGHGTIWQGILGSQVPECGLEGPCRFTWLPDMADGAHMLGFTSRELRKVISCGPQSLKWEQDTIG